MRPSVHAPRRVSLALLCASLLIGAFGPASAQTISFGKSVLSGTALSNPTSLQFGPDGRLYVVQHDGMIRIYDINRTAPNAYSVSATETIALVHGIPNHDDNGSANPAITGRQSTGLLVAGTAANPVIYVTSSDPRVGAGSGSGGDDNLDTNSGILSRLTWDGAAWVKVDLVRGLPRSEDNHSTNGMALDTGANTLYIAQGGHTNMGAPSNNFAFLPEYALSAAILSVDLAAIGNTTYDLPTLDDPAPGRDSGTPGVDLDDPFGGNDGANQARLVPGGPVQVYSPGYRNPYDLVINALGRMYTIDNGPNSGWGDVPEGEGGTACTNGTQEPGVTHQDTLHYVIGAGFYGGHPNPTRANTANTFGGQSPVSAADPVQCDYLIPGTEDGALATFAASTNGLTLYTAGSFGGAMNGDMLAASFDNVVYRIRLSADGTATTLVQPMFSSVGSVPIDVTAQGDAGPFAGSIWVANYISGAITVYEPDELQTCTGADNPALDEDGDQYTNADEIDNGTNPCSAGDVPPDYDNDFVSNLNDPDDDNDGLPDTSDPFAIDPGNGTTTNLPIDYTWDNGQPGPGGLLELGFTGLMTDGVSDYETLFDPDAMTAGGAAGVLTIDAVPDGDAFSSANTQQYGFQVGVDVTPASGQFTAHTRVLAPFAGVTPASFQSMGLFLGTGDQDNYVKLVVSANDGVGGIEFAKELGGGFGSRPQPFVPMPGPQSVDLYLTVDPVAATVQPAYIVTTGGVGSSVVLLGAPEPVPASWFTGPYGLAVGIISTSAGPATPFPATWDFIKVRAGGPAECTDNAACDDANPCSDDACVSSTCVHTDNTASCDDGIACTSGDLCGGGVCAGASNCAGGESCNHGTGTCELIDSDDDGLGEAVDPCPLEPRNQCYGPVAIDGTTGNPIRINANVSASECSGTKVDCNGQTWLADFGYNQPGDAFTCDLNGGQSCVIGGITPIFGCDSESTQDLFRCEHWDDLNPPDLVYTFAVPNGRYIVNLFFANIFSGTQQVGDRVFDIFVEGQLAHDDFDQVAAAGGSGVAVVRSAVADVLDGSLTIHLGRVVENPSIKAIEVLREDRDGDGFFPPNDCNDTDPAVHPGVADDVCDGTDDDCDGQTDEDYTPTATTCGIGACASTGVTSCAGGAVSDSCTPGTPAVEICDGLDNDCNGVADDAAAPAGDPGITASEPVPGTVLFSWTAVPGASAYDVVRGSLSVLTATQGDFTTAVDHCAADNTTDTSLADSDPPPVDDGFFYLLRPVNCGGGTYDQPDPSQDGLRDPEIALSAAACP